MWDNPTLFNWAKSSEKNLEKKKILAKAIE